MNELHLFAGAGGGILGGILCGHTCVCAVEIEPYCRKVLLQRQRDGMLPRFPIWDDVTTFDGKPWRGLVDVVCGGFPCQDISSAGKGAGITGDRSGLWREMARIIGEVRPGYVFIENSPLLRTRGLNVVLKDLAEMGYDARWGVLGAVDIGAPHKRDRMWIVGNSNDNRKPSGCRDDEVAELSIVQAGNAEPSNSNKAQLKRGGLAGGIHKEHANPCSVSWWKDSSPLHGVDDGVANRLDRLAAIGNGQVPSVAALAWKTLKS